MSGCTDTLCTKYFSALALSERPLIGTCTPMLLSGCPSQVLQIEEQEGECLSRLAAVDMALQTCRRLTMVSQQSRASSTGNAAASNANLVQTRARLQSGVYGFQLERGVDGDDDEDCKTTPWTALC